MNHSYVKHSYMKYMYARPFHIYIAYVKYYFIPLKGAFTYEYRY